MSYQHDYYLKNKEYIKQRQREYTKNHKEQNKEYRKKHKKQRKQYRKERIVKGRKIMHGLKTNGCAICGFSECDEALDFHHVNPQDKEFQINILGVYYPINKITSELNKCILLCKNCHTKIHVKEWRENVI